MELRDFSVDLEGFLCSKGPLGIDMIHSIIKSSIVDWIISKPLFASLVKVHAPPRNVLLSRRLDIHGYEQKGVSSEIV